MNFLCYFAGLLALVQAKEEGSLEHIVIGVVAIVAGVALTILM